MIYTGSIGSNSHSKYIHGAITFNTYRKISNIRRTKPTTQMFLIFACCSLCAIYLSQMLSGEWRCSWSSADRRCSNYILVINKSIAYKSATYIRDLTVIYSNPNVLVYQSKYVFQILRKNQTSDILFFSRHHKMLTLYPSHIFDKYIFLTIIVAITLHESWIVYLNASRPIYVAGFPIYFLLVSVIIII